MAKLKELRQLGINRLSIGVQSFNDKHLKTLGRIHSAQEARVLPHPDEVTDRERGGYHGRPHQQAAHGKHLVQWR